MAGGTTVAEQGLPAPFPVSGGNQDDKPQISVYKRGRNAKSFTMAKNATMSDYRKATGFEALMGYLYLKDEFERLVELVKTGIEEMKLKL